MDVFVTGAGGFIGSAVARALVTRGHRVRGLARSDAAEVAVRSAGAEPVHGSLADLDVLAAAAAEGDGVVHLAADPGPERVTLDAAATAAMLDAMSRGGFVGTTGAPRARSSRIPVAEDDVADPGGPLAWLAESEARTLSHAGIRGAVIRPPIVYGDGAGPVADMVSAARRAGAARYVGNGENRWSMVHVADLAIAYTLILETEATGIFHAAELDSVSMRDLANAIGHAAGVPSTSWTLDEALAAHGPMAGMMAMDAALDAGRLRSLGWAPRFGDAVHGVLGALRNPVQGYATATGIPER